MFTLKIVTPKKEYATYEINSATLPTTDGQITLLSNHMDLITPISIGVLILKSDKLNEEYAVSDGLFTFKNNEASLLVNTIENAKDIDFERALRAKEEAKEQLKKDLSVKQIKEAELDLKRSLVRLSLER